MLHVTLGFTNLNSAGYPSILSNDHNIIIIITIIKRILLECHKVAKKILQEHFSKSKYKTKCGVRSLEKLSDKKMCFQTTLEGFLLWLLLCMSITGR